IVTFTVALNNAGPDAATGVRVTDLLAPGLTFVNAFPGQGTYDPTTGLWTVGTVEPGAPLLLVIHARVESPSQVANVATITGADQFDPNPGNNSSTVTETPQRADVAIAKAVSDATPNVGDTITFTIAVTNNGPNTATNVRVQDLLPTGLVFVSATPTQGSY